MFVHSLCAFGTLQHTAAIEHFALANLLSVRLSNCVPVINHTNLLYLQYSKRIILVLSFYLPLILAKLPTTPLQRFECHHYNEKFYVFSRNLNRILIPRAKTRKINKQCLLNIDLLIRNSYRFREKLVFV